MNKKKAILLPAIIISLLICLFALISCAKNTNGIVDYTPYAEIPEDYSLENAKADDVVVYEDSDISSGQSIWDKFLENTKKGTPCMVRLAFYYTLGDPSRYAPELYEEIKCDYPQLYIQDLNFDGKTYTLFFTEDEKEYSCQYEYLIRFEEVPTSNTATYSESIHYVLLNDSEVTWEQITHSMISSQFGDRIDHKTVYSKYIM
jgi:hypothetical protein